MRCVFSPELYGVEPVGFYLKNLLLNWNIVAPLAALAPILALSIWILAKFRVRAIVNFDRGIYTAVFRSCIVLPFSLALYIFLLPTLPAQELRSKC